LNPRPRYAHPTEVPTPKKPTFRPWSVVHRTKADGAKFDGYYVRWVDARGCKHTTFAGKRRETAQAVLTRKKAEAAQRDVATTILPAVM
jgi:hypothetical protein